MSKRETFITGRVGSGQNIKIKWENHFKNLINYLRDWQLPINYQEQDHRHHQLEWVHNKMKNNWIGAFKI